MAKWSCGPTGARGALLGTSGDKGIKKGRISERSGPRVMPAALGGGVPRSVSNLRGPPGGPPGMGGRDGFEENRPLRKPLAAVLVVVWLVLLLTTAGLSGAPREGVFCGFCGAPPGPGG